MRTVAYGHRRWSQALPKPRICMASGASAPAADDAGSAFDGSGVPLRVVTAASLFDGHDAAINVMRRLIQAAGCEVIHLGHDRSAL